jgi:predicted dehydrogenase
MTQHDVLIVGCGSIGERHLRCFQSTGRAMVAACDVDPALLQTISASYGVPVFNDWKRAIADPAYDVALIATPAHLHVPMAMEALRNGKHVLLEKPLAQSLAGVSELLELRDRSGLKVGVAYVYRVLPYMMEAGKFVANGGLGPVRQVSVVTGQPFHLHRPAYARTYYRDRQTGGGAVQDALTHFVNWVEGVIGPADTVLCDAAHLMLPEVEVEDTVHVSARHGAVMANYTLNQYQAPNETTIQFQCSGGSVRIDIHDERWGTFAYGDQAWTWRRLPTPEPVADTPYIDQAIRFLDYLDGDGPCDCSLEEAVHTLKFGLAAYASNATGRRVSCGDFA